MTREIMMIIMAISAILLAIGATYTAMWVSKRINNKGLACLISMILGIALVITLLILAYWVLPAMVRTTVPVMGSAM